MGTVTVSLGYTMNLGNFESLRFDYGVATEIGPNEGVHDALVRVHGIVEKRLQDQINEEVAARNG